MPIYSVVYTRIPTNYNSDEVAMVEANSAEEARRLVVRKLGDDRRGLSAYVVKCGTEYKPEPIDGRIISMGGGPCPTCGR